MTSGDLYIKTGWERGGILTWGEPNNKPSKLKKSHLVSWKDVMAWRAQYWKILGESCFDPLLVGQIFQVLQSHYFLQCSPSLLGIQTTFHHMQSRKLFSWGTGGMGIRDSSNCRDASSNRSTVLVKHTHSIGPLLETPSFPLMAKEESLSFTGFSWRRGRRHRWY